MSDVIYSSELNLGTKTLIIVICTLISISILIVMYRKETNKQLQDKQMGDGGYASDASDD